MKRIEISQPIHYFVDASSTISIADMPHLDVCNKRKACFPNEQVISRQHFLISTEYLIVKVKSND